MEKISSLTTKLSSIAADYSHLKSLSFQESELFSWRQSTKTVYFHGAQDHAEQYLLHEFGHALLDHGSYRKDIDLIKMERDAWREATSLGKKLKITIDQELVEDALDSYRDWLHSRSLCPNCGATGIQTIKDAYRCISCAQTWRVNEARICALRRYKT